jgi:hypothetical protein
MVELFRCDGDELEATIGCLFFKMVEFGPGEEVPPRLVRLLNSDV